MVSTPLRPAARSTRAADRDQRRAGLFTPQGGLYRHSAIHSAIYGPNDRRTWDLDRTSLGDDHRTQLWMRMTRKHSFWSRTTAKHTVRSTFVRTALCFSVTHPPVPCL